MLVTETFDQMGFDTGFGACGTRPLPRFPGRLLEDRINTRQKSRFGDTALSFEADLLVSCAGTSP
jgi:hypothetical protein